MVEPALELLELSSLYGFHDEALLEKTKAGYQGSIQTRMFKKWAKLVLGIVAALGLLYFAYKKKWLQIRLR